MFAMLTLLIVITSPVEVHRLPQDRNAEASRPAVETGGNHYCRVERETGPVNSPLMIAIWQGDLPMLAKLTSTGINFNRTVPFDCNDDVYTLQTTPLLNAINAGRPEIVEFLLKHGANSTFRPNNKTSPLLEAASKGNLKIVRMLLKHGAVVDDPDDANETPLLRAVQLSGSSDVIRELLSAGANINFRNKFGDNAVMLAALQHNIEAVKLLIGLGVDACAKNDDGETAIDRAKTNVTEDPGKREIISFLHERCAHQ